MRRLRRRAAPRHAGRHRSPTTTSTRCGTVCTTTRPSSTTSAARLNYQLNTAHRFQYLIQGDDKIQNSRGASATTAKEATNRQFSDYWHGFPQPTHSLTHTYIASDKLVFNNIYTYVYGGWTNDFQDYDTCGKIRYNGSRQVVRLRARRRELPVEPAAAHAAHDRIPQPLAARVDPAPAADARAEDRRHLFPVEQAGRRPLAEVRRRLSPRARRRPSRTIRAARCAYLQCNGNLGRQLRRQPDRSRHGRSRAWCRTARSCTATRCATARGGATTATSRTRSTAASGASNGGLRYDWQHSKYDGGCVPENVIRPDLLPGAVRGGDAVGDQSEHRADGEDPAVRQLSPRVSVTYDLFGNGKTALKAGGVVLLQDARDAGRQPQRPVPR